MAEAELILKEYRIECGFALIIVNENFDISRARWPKRRVWKRSGRGDQDGSPLLDRPGADKDKECLKRFCESTSWSVTQEENLTVKKMRDLFDTISEPDKFRSNDAFICFISSHGNEGGINGVDGKTISVDEIVCYFKKVPSLVNKPKLFFIQNCRGINVDSGEPYHSEVEADSGYMYVPPPPPILVPKEADILVAYASSDGYEAYRNVDEGSWFITELTHVLEMKAENMSLTDILAIVSERVAIKEHRDKAGRIRKQMPCFTSSLRKSVYLKPTVATPL